MTHRRNLLLFLLIQAGLASGLSAAPSKQPGLVNAAPGFSGGAAMGRKIQLSSLRGKPVVLIIASSPRDPSFRRQCGELRGCYERLAAQGLVAFAAFTSKGGRISSNIPFVTADDPTAVAAAYDVQGFAVAVIGRDGNLDCLSTKPLPGQRVHDLIMNNAEVQRLLRR